MAHQKLILASASPRRQQLLEQIGIIPDEIIPADIKEVPAKSEKPKAYVERLAREKAQHIAKQHPDAFVIGADTIVVCGRHILEKAENEEEAIEFLKLLSGRRHHVLTSMVVIEPKGKISQRTSESSVKFKRLTEEDIQSYIKARDWESKAAGYSMQGTAGQFVQYIQGSHTGIIGMDLYSIAQMLRGLGYVS